MKYVIPQEVHDTIGTLQNGGYQAYLVGGCVRDLVIDIKPKDWDIATNARPEEVQKLFPDSVYENTFGTVGVKTESADKTVKVIEVTTFRIEGKYTDKRHPDEITFAKTIEEDLSRRDFTINALALDVVSNKIIDPFDGRQDLEQKIIRAVGNPDKRFTEDALRLMRAVRLATVLEFVLEEQTASAVRKHAALLETIAQERIRDELTKLIITPHAAHGVRTLEELKLLRFVIPELRAGIDCGQNKHHIYTVWEHNVRALEYSASKGYSFEVRLASLLHDVGKPKTKRGEGYNSTFYNHEVVGAKITVQILNRLKFSKKVVERVVHLVRYHLFYYNVDEVSAAGVRRFINRVGTEYIDELLKVREADRIGSGVPKAVPYKTRHLLYMIEKVQRDPVSTDMLALDGSDVMKAAGITPGPKVGLLLHALMEEVLDDPKKNKKMYLKKRVKELLELSDKKLIVLAERGQERVEEFERGIEREMKKKYYVK